MFKHSSQNGSADDEEVDDFPCTPYRSCVQFPASRNIKKGLLGGVQQIHRMVRRTKKNCNKNMLFKTKKSYKLWVKYICGLL